MTQEPMYIVLELDEPIASQVLQLRQACDDDFRASLPAEITLTGSSGVGPLAPNQTVKAIAEVLQKIAETTAPVHGSFGSVLRFPNTNLFVLPVEDELPFHGLHQQLLISGLQFKPSAFHFKPHCTISSNAVTYEEAEQRLQLTLPGLFTLSNIALYGLQDGRVTRMAGAKLHG